MRRIDHQRSLRYSRFVGNVSHEAFHLPCAVQHRVIHVDVYDGRSVLDLLCCNLKSGFVIT